MGGSSVKRAIMALVAVALTLTLLDGPAQANKIVRSDPGGLVLERLREIEALRAAGAHVWVYGRCASACTLYLGLGAQVCTLPSAEWLFHGPRGKDGRTRLAEWAFEYTTKRMAQEYPAPLAKWFMAIGRHTRDKQYYRFTGAQMIEFGIKECPRPRRR